MKELPIPVAKALLKKWRKIRTMDIKKRDSNWIVTKNKVIRGRHIRDINYTNVKHIYLARIEQANRIINECEQILLNYSQNETKKTTLEQES